MGGATSRWDASSPTIPGPASATAGCTVSRCSTSGRSASIPRSTSTALSIKPTRRASDGASRWPSRSGRTRQQLAEIGDMELRWAGVFPKLVLVSIKKRYPGHARKVMNALWGLGQMMFSKVIVVVDEDVDVHDPKEVVWKVLNHTDPERDT